MLRNYLKTAFRTLWRNKNFTIINIVGLAVGITVCLVIFLIIQLELSFDSFHSKKDRIHRVLTELHSADGMNHNAGVPYPLPTAIRNDFASMKTSGIYGASNDQFIITDEKNGQTLKKFKEEDGIFFVEPAFFEIFDFPLLAGEWKTLKDPYTALLTRETAERYFGDWRSAIGKSFKRNNNQVFRVTGILASIPANSDLQMKIVGSYATLKDFTGSTDWVSVSSNHGCYILLPEGMSKDAIDQQLKQFSLKYKKEDNARNIQVTQSLSQVHFDAEAGNFLGRTISKKLITILGLIASFILLIACVNFINLSTAQAVNRSKEVAVRKVLGGNRAQLKMQFFGEMAMITLTAIAFAVGFTIATVSYLKSILDLPLSFNIKDNPVILLFLVGIAIVIIVLAGFYPAIILSRFKPVAVLKNKLSAGKTKGLSLRRGLVVFQFVIAQALIIGTLIIVKQMDYFRNQPLGFDKQAIVNVHIPDDSAGISKIDYLRNKLLDIKGVRSASFSFGSPAEVGNWYSNFRFNHAEKETDWGANMKWADAHYVKTYNLQLLVGRDILPSDTSREFIVNETLVKRLGITDPREALNKEIEVWGQMRGPIVGVIKDFHATSFREAMPPVLITTVKNFYNKAGIKLEMQSMEETLKKIEALWNGVYPEFVYQQRFLDEKIESFYSDEKRLSYLYKIFAGLAIFLSCLGLYGLASFMTVQRLKEVGIRKVLGASVSNILLLFSKEFLVLITIAFAIAAPVAWYFMHKWLQDFVYRISIPWWIIALSGILALLIALVTISTQALKAAVTNPVKSLRME
jgi:putative ABC transport system permease protein